MRAFYFNFTNLATFIWLPCRANSFTFFSLMFPSPAKLPKWITENLMNTSVKSQLLKHLQGCQAHVTLTATVEEWKTWTDADVGETSLQLLASNRHPRAEEDGAGTNFHNSRMFHWILWLAVEDTAIPNMEQNLKMKCLLEIYHMFLIQHMTVVKWCYFPPCISQTMAIRYGLASKAGCKKIASPLTVLGLWLLVASLASHYKEILKEKQCQKATRCFDQSEMEEILHGVHTPPRTNCQFTRWHITEDTEIQKCIRFGSHV